MIRARYLWYVLGAGMIAFGLRGLLLHVSMPQLLHAARLLVIDVAGHDGLFAPLCVGAGVATARFVPRAARTAVRVGLALAVVLVLLALPSITSEHRLRNPSVLPLDYERNLGLLLGLVVVGVVTSTAFSAVQRRRAAGRGRRTARPPAG